MDLRDNTKISYSQNCDIYIDDYTLYLYILIYITTKTGTPRQNLRKKN